MSKIRSALTKKWADCNFSQKRSKIYNAIRTRIVCFWKVCGKERQKYYLYGISYRDESLIDIDKIRDDIVSEYLECLEKGSFFDKELKIKTIKRKLLR